MPSLTRRRVSASLLVIAVAKVASAQSTTTYVNGTPATTPAPLNPYAGSETSPSTAATLVNTPAGAASTNLALDGVLGTGGFVTTDTSGSTNLIYEYAANNSTPVLTGPTTGVFASLAGVSSQTYKSANFAGTVVGQATRYIPSTNASAGSDAFLYSPSTGTPIIIGDQGLLGQINTSQTIQGQIYYSYNASTTLTVNGTATTYTGIGRTIAPIANANTTGVTSVPTGINANNQVILTATRTNGLSNSSFGTDAFLFTPSLIGSNASTAVVGLSGTALHYYYGTFATAAAISASGLGADYQTSTSSPVALNAGGAVVGTTLRYTPNTLSNTYSAGSAASFGIGTDAWVYSGGTALGLGTTGGNTAVGSVQVGLVGQSATADQGGGYYSVQVTNGGGPEISQTSGVAGISTAGAVTGTSNVYSANSSTQSTANSLSIGTDAWQFKPTLVGGTGTTTATANGFGAATDNNGNAAGTYVQLGLTALPSTTTVGYQSSAGARIQAVSATNAAGNVAGLSTRYFAGSTSTFGTDAWYYNGVRSSLITPTANSSYSNYTSVATTAGYSNASSSTVVGTMSASGLVAGTQTRYLTTASTYGTTIGSDVWAYSPLTNQTYVIASPSLLANDSDFATADAAYANANEYFNGGITSVSDNGLVVGTFNATAGSSSSNTSLGNYVFAWTQQAGTVVLGSVTNTSSGVADLTLNTASGTANINVGTIYADTAGDIFGLGYLTGSTTPEVYEFATATTLASVPEPTSLAALGLGATALLARRRRPSA